MDLKFCFNQNLYNQIITIEGFITDLLDLLLKDKIISFQLYQNLQSNLQYYDQILSILFQNYSESLIKTYISNYFECQYLDFKQLNHRIDHKLLSNQNIIQIAQKYKALPIKLNKKCLQVAIDNFSQEAHQYYLNFFNTKRIEYVFVDRQTIINYFNKQHANNLKNFAIDLKQNPNNAKTLQKNASQKRYAMLVIVLILTAGCFFSKFFLILMIILANGLYFISMAYKLILGLIGIKHGTKKNVNSIKENITNFFDKPKYTILLPIYHEEKNILLQLITSIKNLNYPLHQLDIYVILEKEDQMTQAILDDINLDYIFTIIHVHNIFPKTKAKACNYAFPFAAGKYLTVYDADDIPNRNQLYQVIEEFSKNSSLGCVQCTLNSYNHCDNLLTKFYSIEYSLWFKSFLPALCFLKMPITFGGTSNHFKTDILAQNLWDPYNVTEDADLGIRFWLQQHEVSIISNTTMEEAPITINSWIKQRSRWIKGFLQTYFVHLHANKTYKLKFWKRLNFLNWLNLFVLAPILSQALFIFIILEFAILKFYFQDHTMSYYLTIVAIINLLINYIMQITNILINKNKLIFKTSYIILLFPLYNMLNIIATYRAINQFFTKQYHWEKTLHGLANSYHDCE